MDIVVFEDRVENFGPLVAVRTVGQLRCGQHRLIDHVERLIGRKAPVFCRTHLAEWVTLQTGRTSNMPTDGPTLALTGRGLWTSLPVCDSAFAGFVGDELACLFVPEGLSPESDLEEVASALPREDVSSHVRLFSWPWELILQNAKQIVADWSGKAVRGVIENAIVLNPGSVHIGHDVHCKPGVIIDADDGPIWIGDRVKIGPNATIQGPCVIGDDCTIQAHALIREGVTLGPFCKVGGEIEETIIQGFSNKQHHGFLGHSYLGEWINLGAGCTNSDLKNTYGEIRMPILGNPASVPETPTGSQFCGMVAGDYAKLGINTAVPTGAVIGFASNVVGPTAPKWVDDFRWVTPDENEPFEVDRAISIGERMMQRRGKTLGEAGARLLRSIGST